MVDEGIKAKHQRANEIIAEIARLEDELRKIYHPQTKSGRKKSSSLPRGFSLKGSVFAYIDSKGSAGAAKSGIVPWIKTVHGVSVSADQVQGALSNLKAEGKIEIVRRGVYAKKDARQEQPTQEQ
ncbi:MAG: hypothetical protein Q7S96_03595 [bacterium]|nr:hypothetical protein [bacterium]